MIIYYWSMPRNPVLTFRLPEDVFAALVRERRERHLNVSGWARAAVLEAFHRDFPDDARDNGKPASPAAATQKPPAAADAAETPPLRGWRACTLPEGGLGARHDDPASLPHELVGQRIEVKTNAGGRLRRWVLEVTERSADHVFVRDGRDQPRDA